MAMSMAARYVFSSLVARSKCIDSNSATEREQPPYARKIKIPIFHISLRAKVIMADLVRPRLQPVKLFSCFSFYSAACSFSRMLSTPTVRRSLSGCQSGRLKSILKICLNWSLTVSPSSLGFGWFIIASSSQSPPILSDGILRKAYTSSLSGKSVLISVQGPQSNFDLSGKASKELIFAKKQGV